MSLAGRAWLLLIAEMRPRSIGQRCRAYYFMRADAGTSHMKAAICAPPPCSPAPRSRASVDDALINVATIYFAVASATFASRRLPRRCNAAARRRLFFATPKQGDDIRPAFRLPADFHGADKGKSSKQTPRHAIYSVTSIADRERAAHAQTMPHFTGHYWTTHGRQTHRGPRVSGRRHMLRKIHARGRCPQPPVLCRQRCSSLIFTDGQAMVAASAPPQPRHAPLHMPLFDF